MLSCVFFYDPIALWTLVVTIIGVVVGIVAAIAALVAAVYAKRAPTAGDLARVEQNTAHLEDVRTTIGRMEGRSKKQEEAESIRIRAYRVPIAASGNMSGTSPFPLRLSIRESREPKVSITHVELYNEHGNQFGSLPCSPSGESGLIFEAQIPMETMGEWHAGGTPVLVLNRVRLKLRVWMLIDGIDVYRDMAVVVTQTISGANMGGYHLQGRV